MFITFEGIEGSGKTTQIDIMIRFLSSKGLACIGTREPGDTFIGKKIRSILLNPEHTELVSQAELFLYAADRAQHVSERIRPALSEGKIVICDRFSDATLAYQGYARGIDLSLIQQINSIVLEGLKPDITFLFDLSPEEGLKRAWSQINGGNRDETETRFENEKIAFHEKVRRGYLSIAEKEQERFIIIDAMKSREDVTRQMINTLSERMTL